MARYVNEATIARLLAVDVALICRDVAAGRYGRVRAGARHQTLINLKHVEHAHRRLFSEEQLAAAIAPRSEPILHIHKTWRQHCSERFHKGGR